MLGNSALNHNKMKRRGIKGIREHLIPSRKQTDRKKV